MVLEKKRYQLVRSCEEGSITKSQGEEEYPATVQRKKANWIGHILLETAFYNVTLKD